MKTGSLMLAKRYALAFNSVATDTNMAATNLATFEEDLKQLEPISSYIESPVLPYKIKEELLDKTLGKNEGLSLIKVLVKAKRFNLLEEVHKELKHLLDTRRGIKRVIIKVASALEDKNKKELEETLSIYFKTKLEVSYEIDASLLAGIKVIFGDFYLDTSALARIEQLRENLMER